MAVTEELPLPPTPIRPPEADGDTDTVREEVAQAEGVCPPTPENVCDGEAVEEGVRETVDEVLWVGEDEEQVVEVLDTVGEEEKVEEAHPVTVERGVEVEEADTSPEGDEVDVIDGVYEREAVVELVAEGLWLLVAQVVDVGEREGEREGVAVTLEDTVPLLVVERHRVVDLDCELVIVGEEERELVVEGEFEEVPHMELVDVGERVPEVVDVDEGVEVMLADRHFVTVIVTVPLDVMVGETEGEIVGVLDAEMHAVAEEEVVSVPE